MRPRARRWAVLLGALGAGALIGLAVAARFGAGGEHVGCSDRDAKVDEGLTLQGAPRTTAAGTAERAEGSPRVDEVAGSGLRVDGLVVDAAGKPVPETTVVFVPAQGELQRRDYRAERVEAIEGRFGFEIQPVRRGWIRALAPTYLPTYVVVAPPGPREPLRIVLEEAPPLRVVLLAPDGTRVAGGGVYVRPAPSRVASDMTGPGDVTFELEGADADEQGEALLRIGDSGAIQLDAHGEIGTWPLGLKSRPVLLERAAGTVELHLEPISRVVVTATEAGTKTPLPEHVHVRAFQEGKDVPTPDADVSGFPKGRSLVKGLLRGRLRLEIGADGFLTTTRTIALTGTGERVTVDVELERDSAQGRLELTVPCTFGQHVEVLARKRDDVHRPWTPLFGLDVPLTTEPARTESVPRTWRSQALALGTYDLLILRFNPYHRDSASDPAGPIVCAWLPGVVVEGRAITSRSVTPGPGLFVPVPSLDATPQALESLRVLGPEAGPLPQFVYKPRWTAPGPSGFGDHWNGIELVRPDQTPAAGTVLGPYPVASVTLELKRRDGPPETRVYDGR